MIKRPLISLLILLILLIAVPCFATDYYVKNGGNDGSAGTSDGAAWETIGKLNSVDFASGDVIYLNKEDTWSDATLTFAGVTSGPKTVTLDSYGTGAKPILDGNVVQPIEITNSEIDIINLQNIQIIGLDFVNGASYPKDYGHIYIADIDHLLIDGIDFNGHTGTSTYRHHEFFIGTNNPPVGATVEIKNCNIQNLRPNDDPTQWDGEGAYEEAWYGEQDGVLIHIQRQVPDDEWNTGSLSIHDNVIHGVWSDGILLSLTRMADQNIYNNTIYGYGENAMDLKGTQYTKIHNNNFYRNGYGFGGASYSVDHYAPGSGVADVVTHDQAVTDPDTTLSDMEVYENYFSGTTAVGLRLIGHTANSTVAHNRIEAACQGIIISGASSDGNKIYGNELRVTGTAADVPACYASGIVLYPDDLDDTLVYNNTILVDTGFSGIYYSTNAGMSGNIIRNNIIYSIRDHVGAYPLRILGAGTGSTIGNNSYYSTQNTNRVNDDSTYYTTANFSTWVADGHTDDLSGDPGLVSSTYLWPSSSASAVYQTGYNVGYPYDMLMLLTSDFTASPPSVYTDQFATDYIGAYGLLGAAVVGGALNGVIPTGVKLN